MPASPTSGPGQKVSCGPRFDTLPALLRWRAEHQSDRLAYTFLLDGEEEEVRVTYAELDRDARAVGAWIQAHGMEPGNPVLILYPPGPDFIAALFGCLYSGMPAIPICPPHPTRRNRTLARVEAVVADAAPSAILTSAELLPTVHRLYESHGWVPARGILASDRLRQDDHAGAWSCPAVDAGSLAILQYTSGSTGTPNGVMLDHGNLLHNLEQIRLRFEHTEDSRGMIWLPPFHDMGLIGGILQPIYAGFPVTLMSPLHFLQQPLRWLRAVSRVKATTSGGPNFAFQLCVERVHSERRKELDLSFWEVAFIGAEPVRAETLDAFAKAFASCGFRREAFYPCYGLAESTLITSGGAKAAPPIYGEFQADRLRSGQALAVTSDTRGAQVLVGCGRAVAGQEIAIVCPDRRVPRADGEFGEIWVRGPSVARGYWCRPEQTECTFRARLAHTEQGPFLRTGDLGFLTGGELFVTGRLKDLIIINGQNHYPQDIEATVERSHPAILRPGGCLAFSVDRFGEERLIVVVEVDRSCLSPLSGHGAPSTAETHTSERPGTWSSRDIVRAVRRAVSEHHETSITEVVLVKPATIPRTSSGKPQRLACREAFLRGDLESRRIERAREGPPGVPSP